MKFIKFNKSSPVVLSLLGVLLIAGCGDDTKDKDLQRIQTQKANARANVKAAEIASAKGYVTADSPYGVWERADGLIEAEGGGGEYYYLFKFEPSHFSIINVCTFDDGSAIVARATVTAVTDDRTIALDDTLKAVEMSGNKLCPAFFDHRSLSYTLDSDTLEILADGIHDKLVR